MKKRARSSAPLSLGAKQRLFSLLVSRLLSRAYELGYELSLGEAYRPPETAALYAKKGKGISGSLHSQRLAIDLNLFQDGTYLRKSEDHRPLGEWWEKQHELCRWGGRFGDGNHYSFEHGGKK